jgi:hypothetical protein
MVMEQFSLESLNSIDEGRIREAVNAALKRCDVDCRDRPALKDARKVTIEISLEPQVGDTGDLHSVDVSFSVSDKQPKRKSRTYNMASVPGGLLFNERSPEDIKQGTLDLETGPTKAVGEAADVS